MENTGKEFSKNVVIINTLGLHARSAAKIAKCVQNRKSNVWIIKDGVKADASSIMDVLTLVCEKGAQITIQIDDRSDLGILHQLIKLVESGFEE